MQITNLVNINSRHKNSSFNGRGKPLDLRYIIEKRSNLLPQRVLEESKRRVNDSTSKKISLVDIHKSIYKYLAECTNLDKIKTLFPEFKNIEAEVSFKRDSVYAKNFKEKVENSFALKMLKAFWVDLKSKEEVAKELGMPSRSSLEWALKKIKFVSLNPNYLNLLKASDAEGNRIIANKTANWNKKNPEQMMAHNKKAAQNCKTEKYRKEQAERMKEYDKKHPERIKKISENNRKAWAICPEIKAKLAEFTKNESDYVKNILRKKVEGKKLTEQEKSIHKNYYKRFWQTYPELKKVFADAKRSVKKSND